MRIKYVRKRGDPPKLDKADQPEPSTNKEEALGDYSTKKRRSSGTRKSAAVDAILTTEDAGDARVDENATVPDEVPIEKKASPKRKRKSNASLAPISTDNNGAVDDAYMADVEPAATELEPSTTRGDSHFAAADDAEDVRLDQNSTVPDEVPSEKKANSKRKRKSDASIAPISTEHNNAMDDADIVHVEPADTMPDEAPSEKKTSSKRKRKSNVSLAPNSTDNNGAVADAVDDADIADVEHADTMPDEATSERKTSSKRKRKSGASIAPMSTDNNGTVDDADIIDVEPAAPEPDQSAVGGDPPRKRKRQSTRRATAVFTDLNKSLNDAGETEEAEAAEIRPKRVRKSRISGASASKTNDGAEHAITETRPDESPSEDATLVNDVSVTAQATLSKRSSRKRKSTASLANGVEATATEAENADNFIPRPKHDSDEFVEPPPKQAKNSRKSRKSGDAAPQVEKKSGLWSAEEKERLDAAITAYGNRHDLSKMDLVRLIQYTIPTVYSDTRGIEFSVEHEAAAKRAVREFWAEIHQEFPERTTTSINRIARRRWHNYEQRGGNWTADDDNLLAELNKLHPSQWKIISVSMKRSPEDCRDRWRNYLQYGEERNTHHWEDYEVTRLNQAVSECVARLLEDRRQSNGSVDDYDPYFDLDWHAVSQKAGGTRSRLQCLAKWKALQEAAEKVDADADASGTPASSAKRKRSSSKAPARKKKPVPRQKKAKTDRRMLAGDKLQLIADITNANVAEEENIPWDDITLANPDSTWTSEERKEAFEMLVNEVGRRPSLDATLTAILDTFQEMDGDEMEQYYVPEEEEEQAPPTSSKKEKRKSLDAQQEKFKSSEFITASDDEEY